MINNIVNFLLNIFEGFKTLKYGKELTVFIISMMPILELRGGLIAASLLDMNPLESYIICIIGNIIPIPLTKALFPQTS